MWAPQAFPGGRGAECAHARTKHRGDVVAAKRADSLYTPRRRSRTWIKIRDRHDQAVVLIGWRARPDGGLRSLLLGLRDEEGVLHHGRRVGVGLDASATTRLEYELRRRRRRTPAAPDVRGRDPHDGRW